MTLSRQHRADLKRKRSKLSPAAKSEHRAGVFEAARVEGNGIVRCYADPSSETCRGRLQAAHWIAVQTLARVQAQAFVTFNRRRFDHPDLCEQAGLLEATLTALVSDPRKRSRDVRDAPPSLRPQAPIPHPAPQRRQLRHRVRTHAPA